MYGRSRLIGDSVNERCPPSCFLSINDLLKPCYNIRNLNALLHRHKTEYNSIYDIGPLSPKSIGETLPKCLGENLKASVLFWMLSYFALLSRLGNQTSLSRSETEHLTTMYKLDILSIAARALVVFSSIKHIELKLGPTHSELQNLVDLLQEVLLPFITFRGINLAKKKIKDY